MRSEVRANEDCELNLTGVECEKTEWTELTYEERDDTCDEQGARVVSFHPGNRHQTEGNKLENEGERHEGLHRDEPCCNERTMEFGSASQL